MNGYVLLRYEQRKEISKIVSCVQCTFVQLTIIDQYPILLAMRKTMAKARITDRLSAMYDITKKYSSLLIEPWSQAIASRHNTGPVNATVVPPSVYKNGSIKIDIILNFKSPFTIDNNFNFPANVVSISMTSITNFPCVYVYNLFNTVAIDTRLLVCRIISAFS